MPINFVSVILRARVIILMYYLRTTKTATKATAVQVVRYDNRKLIVVAHIGSAHTPEELKSLQRSAQKLIEKISKQRSLFPATKSSRTNLVSLEKCRYLGFRYNFIYEILTQLFIRFKFHTLRLNILTDLALMRIMEPTSKLMAIKLLKEFFGIKHSRKHFYGALPKIVALKDKIEAKVLSVAKKELNFDFSLVFYDVTTLYFESSTQDEFRKPGFSKDNKAHKPQILISLIINTDGFPVAYELFEGNRFEGHTIIPVITAFQRKHKIKKLTVVADAAMLSFANTQALQENSLYYIVGARIRNLPDGLAKKISTRLKQTDGASLRLTTKHGCLVCSFSAMRFRKDKYEMEKQIRKAQFALQDPSKMKRLKFVKNINRSRYQLNTELINRTKLLLGIKGYYTNLPPKVNNDTIISHYHNLWRVEQVFRIAKSDLQIRPMYHFKKQAIQAHMLICFMALAVSKYMEIKTEKSIKSIIKTLKSVTDARILNTLTKKEIILRSDIPEELKQILSKLNVSY